MEEKFEIKDLAAHLKKRTKQEEARTLKKKEERIRRAQEEKERKEK